MCVHFRPLGFTSLNPKQAFFAKCDPLETSHASVAARLALLAMTKSRQIRQWAFWKNSERISVEVTSYVCCVLRPSVCPTSKLTKHPVSEPHLPSAHLLRLALVCSGCSFGASWHSPALWNWRSRSWVVNFSLEKLTLLLFLSPSNSHRAPPSPPETRECRARPRALTSLFALVTATRSSFLRGSSSLPKAQEVPGEIVS